jgi:hypothetical protein
VADHRNDYHRAVNALDLVDWLAGLTDDKVTLAHYVDRTRQTLTRLEELLDRTTPQGGR